MQAAGEWRSWLVPHVRVDSAVYRIGYNGDWLGIYIYIRALRPLMRTRTAPQTAREIDTKASYETIERKHALALATI